MIRENFTGLVVPRGLNLPDNYKCGDIIEVRPKRGFYGLLIDLNIGNVDERFEGVVQKLKDHAEFRLGEKRGLIWPVSEMRIWREWLNFVRSEYIESGQQIPIINETFVVGDKFEISSDIYNLTRYNVGRCTENGRKDSLEVEL